jgi:transposase
MEEGRMRQRLFFVRLRTQTIPGLGRFLSVLVVHEIGTIRRFASPAKLCAYAGLVPSVHASGGKVSKRIAFGGNVEAKRPLDAFPIANHIPPLDPKTMIIPRCSW